MSTVLKQTYTLAEYNALEQATGQRHEFYRNEVFAMAGGTGVHNDIAVNVTTLLRRLLRGKKCRPNALDMRLKIQATGLYTYPDVMITCDPIERVTELGIESQLNPRVIFEVLSKSTEAYDRGEKFYQYQTIPSLEAYVLISQSEARVDLFTRQAEGTWILKSLSGLEANLDLVSLGIELPLLEIYADVEFPPPEPPPQLVATERRPH